MSVALNYNVYCVYYWQHIQAKLLKKVLLCSTEEDPIGIETSCESGNTVTLALYAQEIFAFKKLMGHQST